MVGLYIHIPFCKRKCDYCSFYSIPSASVSECYIDALIGEIKSYSQRTKEKVDTIYIGGGTPSLLTKNQLQRIFSAIEGTFDLVSPEISIESNPESINDDFLQACKGIGVNRISIGVQSLNDISLREIGRLHDRKRAIDAIKLCQKYVENINVDYMLGLPEQTLADVESDISLLCSLGVKHLSAYSLILEEETPLFAKFEKGMVKLPNDDLQCDYYNRVVDILKENSLSRYEISNFALKGFECRHNLNCWRLREYIGIGPSAHSFYKGKRYYNQSNLDLYIASNGIYKHVEECDNTILDRETEFIMLGLRTEEGISLTRYKELFGYNALNRFEKALTTIDNYIIVSDDHMKIKENCFYISNYIIELLMECIF